MNFYILRHADKEKGDFTNPHLPLQDPPISQMGEEQARNLQRFFIDKEIAHIYVSAYQRTGQTIAFVAEQFGLMPIVDNRLNEIDIGLFEMCTEDEVREKYPVEWQAYRERKSDFRFPEGESIGEAKKRIAEFLEEKRELHGDENVIAVSHDGSIRTLMCHLLDI
ncbi:MAG: histidine phosphatase family protein, partial [Anaerolineales bacterium]